jgi:GNAT superfamily N-acetyltransferase
VKATVRRVAPSDLGAMQTLCREHAEYERSAVRTQDLCRLGEALFGPAAKLDAWVVVHEDNVVGIASAAACFSTWTAEHYYHLDCLFLRSAARGHGIGRCLMKAIAGHARAQGYSRMEWQTPAWNDPAVRFYEALGARRANKIRFALELDGKPVDW